MYRIILTKGFSAPQPPLNPMSYDAAHNWVEIQAPGNRLAYSIVPVNQLAIELRQQREKEKALEFLHSARVVLGAAGFHDMAREVASVTAQVYKAKPNNNPVI